MGREHALLAGTAIHLMMEWLPESGGIAGGITAEKLDQALMSAAQGGAVPQAARKRADQIRVALADGKLLKLYETVEILGKELPMILNADETGPVGAWVGSIDMLYRDPTTGLPVIVDYKTDFVGGRSIDEVAAHHVAQGRLYVEAVQLALGLAERPRFEVWMLEQDERVVVS